MNDTLFKNLKDLPWFEDVSICYKHLKVIGVEDISGFFSHSNNGFDTEFVHLAMLRLRVIVQQSFPLNHSD